LKIYRINMVKEIFHLLDTYVYTFQYINKKEITYLNKITLVIVFTYVFIIL